MPGRLTLAEGIQEIAGAYDRVPLTRELFEHPIYTKLKQIRKLMDEGKVDDQLRWKQAALR